MPACECCGTAVTLTPEEAALAASWGRLVEGQWHLFGDEDRALAARLGASS